MNTTTHAVRVGVSRGWHEFRQTLASADQMFNVLIAVVFVTVLVFQRDAKLEDTDVSLAAVTLPSMLGMLVAFGGFAGASSQLSTNREDGTLLRAKAVPHGMIGYLVGRVVQVSLDTIVSMLIILIPGLFLVHELSEAGVTGWLTLVWVLALGLLATLPWGVIMGSLAKSPQASPFGFTMLPIMAITGISGIFYPISGLPDWLQVIAQIFPIYWLGLGTRSALLPDSAATAEIGDSWRHLETLGVIGAWAVVGLLLAPTILRRMARRESGSVMEQRRQQAMQRVG
ncbi:MULTISPECIES: ABC transporter permease [unclassified Streptomyces]|uniref:ABC transporter permease n=1 Tax=unclassified Streptomyces TaxID=2593676 RepID=UPI0033EC23E8